MNGSDFLDGIINAWKNDFETLSVYLKKERDNFLPEIEKIFEKNNKNKCDEARLFIHNEILKEYGINLRKTFFFKGIKKDTDFPFKGTKNGDTIQEIMEDLFFDREANDFVFHHQKEFEEIIINCISSEAADFTRFLYSKNTVNYDKDQRYKTMFWFIYLLIDLIKRDEKSCHKGHVYIINRFQELLKCVENKQIVSEDESEIRSYEGGRWTDSFFAYIQDRNGFVEKIIHHFNFNNTKSHANRLLLSDHRKCLCRNTIQSFCK